jgi:hypothetical protein
MSFLRFSANVIMGVVLGFFLFAIVRRWPAFDTVTVGALVVAASIVLVFAVRPFAGRPDVR